MSRRSKREIEKGVERLDASASASAAEVWRAYITGEITPEEYAKQRGGRR